MSRRLGVVLISRNHEPYVDDCFDGLARQTDLELVLRFADNASSDRTLEVAKAAATRVRTISDARFFVGNGDGWSSGLREAILSLPEDLDAVTLLSADDRHKPDALTRSVEALLSPCDVPVRAVTALLENVTERLVPTSWFSAAHPKGTGAYASGDALDILVTSGDRPCMLGVFAPEVFQVAASYLAEVNYADDACLFAALCELGSHIHHLPIHFADYRAHPVSASRSKRPEILADSLRVYGLVQTRTGVRVEKARASMRAQLVREVGLMLGPRDIDATTGRRLRYALKSLRDDAKIDGQVARGAPSLASSFADGLARGFVRAVRKPGGGFRR